ncbi:MAG TPA: hypothetical protein VJT72_16970 [Pseudonocardiaceae bacterium]|nr:hypothetical protein [Pseudonocardiaceae bacterium]
MADYEPTMDVGCGTPELSEELRDALTLLRDRSGNDDFRTLVDDVLAGRCSLVEASSTAAFSDVVFARIAREFTALPDDEKRNLAGRGESAGTGSSCGIPCAGCPSICPTPEASPPG